MKKEYQYLLYSLAIILLLANAGCVAPPKETPIKSVDSHNPNQFAANTSSTSSSFVTEVTLSDNVSSTIQPVGYSTFLPTTQIPADITCSIYSKSAAYGYNGSAFIFDLKNPPMYINYTVVPTNVTVRKVYTNRQTGKTETRIFSDYSPYSWFEITVSNNITKEIYVKEGFGETKGYSTYLSHSFKVLKNGDLLVEFRGNDIKANATIWVKPIENFNESQTSKFTNCMYWGVPRDSLVTPVPTTTPTWKPENVIRQ